MIRYRPLARPLVLGCALLLAATVLHADDTEIYLANTPPGPDAAANILFIIDNSGSMGTEVETQADFDPAVSYAGCYRADALYFSTGLEPPPCSGGAFIGKSANRCAASSPGLTALGQYRGLSLAWNADRERWEPLDAEFPSRPLECEADRGIDGDGAAGEPYAANGPGGPWAVDAADEPAWNAVYTLFDGNWLNWRDNPPTVTRTRLEIVQRVVNGLLDSLDGVNVGLMQFNTERGGAVTQAIEAIGTSRTAMKAAVNGITPLGFTPLSETLYEAAQYLRGGSVVFGDVGPTPSVAGARQGGDPNSTVYQAPLTDACQKTFIVLLTDGEPTRDQEANAAIASLPDFATLVGSCDGSGEGACLDDLAEYLFRSDASAGLAGTQNVVTYTIGFALDFPLLAETARRGGGEFYVVDDTASLTAALTDLVTGITESAGLFAAPAIPVTAFGQSSLERDVYVSLFQPTTTARWPGNLKKYRFTVDGLTGLDGAPAVNPATGFFRTDAQSFWSAVPDGDRVAEGGAASRLPGPPARRLFTDIAGPDLSASGNRIEIANPGLTEALLGVAAADRNALIEWMAGADSRDADADGDTTEPRRQMGDPLHVRPVTTSYGSSAADPDTVVFVATNEGQLHAIDADTGQEIWAYLPGRLLPRQQPLFLDAPTTQRPYGLDGELRLFNGVLSDNNAHKILVFGMGRGGDAVYAVDISSRNAPVLLWEISSSSSGFASLGQVWAAPTLARVDIGGIVRPVLVLTGGYDDGQDNRGLRTDNVGNALFLVDLESGERLWSAGAPDAGHDLELDAMTFSMPAAPRVLDLGSDGLIDRVYVGDMGGQIWRFDLRNGETRSSLGEGGVLASLGAAALAEPQPEDVRRFYATPDVAFVNCDRGTFLAVNIGSGYRGHPLDTDVEDAFFSVRDLNVFGVIDSEDYPSEPTGIGDLLDITTDPTAVVPRDAAGWRLRMVQAEGEKILTGAITLDTVTSFTSFSPGASANSCAAGLGVNRLYQVDTCNGRPVNNLDGSIDSEELGAEDRSRVLAQTGIAPELLYVLPANPAGTRSGCVGLECFPAAAPGSVLPRTYWNQEDGR